MQTAKPPPRGMAPPPPPPLKPVKDPAPLSRFAMKPLIVMEREVSV